MRAGRSGAGGSTLQTAFPTQTLAVRVGPGTTGSLIKSSSKDTPPSLNFNLKLGPVNGEPPPAGTAMFTVRPAQQRRRKSKKEAATSSRSKGRSTFLSLGKSGTPSSSTRGSRTLSLARRCIERRSTELRHLPFRDLRNLGQFDLVEFLLDEQLNDMRIQPVCLGALPEEPESLIE